MPATTSELSTTRRLARLAACIACSIALSWSVPSLAAPGHAQQASGTGFKFSLMHSFGGTDGKSPLGPLAADLQGNFYGTTTAGGANGVGVIFRTQAKGGETTTIHDRLPEEGNNPSGLMRASDGNFYGTAQSSGRGGAGSLFRVGPGGEFTVLHDFTGASTDGGAPNCPPIEGADGRLYGATLGGGAHGQGTVYAIDRNGAFTLLWSFDPASGFSLPSGCPVQGADGRLYGMTAGNNKGGAYRLSLKGAFKGLFQFDRFGLLPSALILGSDGNFYFTTRYGGNLNSGAFYRMTPRGSVKVMLSFDGPSQYNVSLAVSGPGIFYGSSQGGNGAIVQLSDRGKFKQVHDFVDDSGGRSPSGLVMAADGALWGLAYYGGANGMGTVFRLDPK